MKKIVRLTESDLTRIVKRILNEQREESDTVIEITKVVPDERSNRKPKNKFHVNYQTIINDNLIEIEGTLIPYHTGRSMEYEFQPDYFMDEDTEQYYDENWEDIEKEILSKFYESIF
jgi:hypothetical protein